MNGRIAEEVLSQTIVLKTINLILYLMKEIMKRQITKRIDKVNFFFGLIIMLLNFVSIQEIDLRDVCT